MKQLPVLSPAYQYIEKSFKEWLDVLGYSWQVVYYMPLQVRGLLHYLEQHHKTQLTDITAEVIKEYYYTGLKQRQNCLYKAGTLSNKHLNKNLHALKKFTEYLRQTGKLPIALLNIQHEEITSTKPDILTEEEVQQLYKATEVMPENMRHGRSMEYYEAVAMRHRAMLAVFYGCGLRRNEGYHLNTTDINLDSAVLHVRKGKGYKERLVPISKRGIQHITTYLYDGRPMLLKDNKQEAFFIGETGRRLGYQMFLLYLQSLILRTDNAGLQQKEVGLHTLRHSIATHLLGAGMGLEQIRDFLGHGSLESTQIYTHLITEEHAAV